jgi:two-component system, OmpR family, phosphate regulon sensor histidine kinase PhoR
MKPTLRQALIAPAVVAASTLLVWAVLGPTAALFVLFIGGAAVVAFHLYHLQLLSDWAEGALDANVPEGRGPWAAPFEAIYRRIRMRKAHERDLRHLIQRFEQAAAALPDGIVVLDRANRIEWANERAQRELGLDLTHDVRRPIVNLVRQPEFLHYLETGDYGDSVLVESMRNAGQKLALLLVPFAVDKKLLVARDVTHLEAVSRMRRDFIANVSHELKTPLTVIAGFIETLQELDVDAKQRKRFLQLMAEQARNMQRLVSDLLTLSALESEHNALAEERFAIVPLMLQLSADAKALSRNEHEIALDIGEAAMVNGSREELASAFSNLVSNAIRYTPSGGAITLTWRVDVDGSGVFSVKDTGIGIATEHRPRLTERFYRVDRSRSRATGGTGLGLAIVKHVLLRHQAELEVQSMLGQGSTFAVRLPAARVERMSPVPEASATRVRASSEQPSP